VILGAGVACTVLAGVVIALWSWNPPLIMSRHLYDFKIRFFLFFYGVELLSIYSLLLHLAHFFQLAELVFQFVGMPTIRFCSIQTDSWHPSICHIIQANLLRVLVRRRKW
jgi:hypothetical protein